MTSQHHPAPLRAPLQGPRPARPRRSPRGPLIVGAASALLLGAGTWAVVASSHSPSRPAAAPTAATSGILKAVWTANATDTAAPGLVGSWLTPTVVVRGQAAELTGLSLSTGSPAWTFQTPAGTQLCSMSATVGTGGIGVVGFGSSLANCDHLAAVDTRTGKSLWTADLAGSASALPLSSPLISVATDTVADDGPGYSMQVRDLATGKIRWSVPATTSLSAPTCILANTLDTATTVYALSSCMGPSTSNLQLLGYDPSSGARTFTADTNGVPSLDAATLWAASGTLLLVDSTADTAYGYTGSNPAPARVDLSTFDVSGLSPALGQQLPADVAVGPHTLYLPGKADSSGESTAISAVDLTTGKVAWTKSPPDASSTTIVAADATGVQVLVQDEDNLFEIVSFAAATGQATILAQGAATLDLVSDDTFYLSGHTLVDASALLAAGQPEAALYTGVGQ